LFGSKLAGHGQYSILDAEKARENILKYTALCKFDLGSGGRDEAVSELLQLFPFGEKTRHLLAGALEVREHVGATVVHRGIALPHCRSILVDQLSIAVGRSADGIGWPEEKVHTVILFISPVKPNGPEEHAAFLSHIAGRIKEHGDEFASAGSAERLFELLDFQPAKQED
jgi:mannitol/fructose-specific phosphotransferase system IIA component (Ntr-type)